MMVFATKRLGLATVFMTVIATVRLGLAMVREWISDGHWVSVCLLFGNIRSRVFCEIVREV